MGISAKMRQSSWLHPKNYSKGWKNMAIRYKAWTLALACGLFAVPALADDSEGAYVFVSAGQAFAHNACSSPIIPPGNSCSEKTVAYRVGFGYQYTPTWGLEANYGQFGFAESTGFAGFPAPVGPGFYSWQLKANGFALQGVATLHMGDTFALIGKLGLARVEYDEFLGVQAPTSPTGWYYYPTVNDKRNTVALGAGAQFDVTPHGSIRLMVESFGNHDIYAIYGSTTKVRLLTGSVGLMYRY